MQTHIPIKWSLFVIVFVGIVFSSLVIFFLTPTLPVSSSYLKILPAGTLPTRLKIPKIQVDAAFEYVGLTLEGAMDVPGGPLRAAWFNLGPRPGEIGSAVISGHYGWKNNIPAVFDNLNKLKKGDKIYIKDKGGVTNTFVVNELKTYGENDDASRVFNSSDGRAHLNLITCQGIWNKNKKSYSERLVVFTDKE